MKTLEIKSLEDGWCDRDFMMLHACFQLLEDFVEQELRHDVCCDKHAEVKIRELYDWWQGRKHFDGLETLPAVYDVDTEKLIELMKIRYLLWT